MPPIERFTAAIERLDEPLPALMAKTLQLGQQAQRNKHLEQARSLFESVVLHGDNKIAAQAAQALAAMSPTTKPN